MKTLYIVAGPTASGKTSFAIELAQKLNTEIVSADSRQIFKEMNIGVARPTPEELAMVRHHLIATWSVMEEYNVARYEKEAMQIINSLFQNHDSLVLCGGSGMYINAIINGIDEMPDCDTEIRKELQKTFEDKGLSYLQDLLKEKDPEYFAEVDIQNHRRVMRALEVCIQTGRPFSSFRLDKKAERDFNIKILGIERNREELVKRIDDRVDIMMQMGQKEEAKELYKYKDLPSLSTVGYRELFEYFDNRLTLDQAIEQIKIHTRQYAKRQMTWFRKTEGINWLNFSKGNINIEEIL